MAEADIPSAAIAGAVAAGRALLRLEGGQEDALLGRLGGTALLLAEAFVGQRLIVRGFVDRVPADGAWHRLVAEPVTALVGDGFAVDIDAHGVGWVRATGGGVASVAYSAGLATTWEALPAALAQGVALLAAHLFEHREGDAAPPSAIAALWRPWRRMRLGSARRVLAA
ncbi:hypothetical protein [Sphingomonas sp.]|uniref:hypothetical protein n=1 Tax=Sphingomonas sp. TaxID=28214 RepID=UPI002ED8A469